MTDNYPKPRLPGKTKQLPGGPSNPSRTESDVAARYRLGARRHSKLIGLSDATGSMAGVWDSTRNHIVKMVDRLSELGSFSVNWVAFRDYTDGNELLSSSGWQDDAQKLLAFIRAIQCHGGGDEPEAVEYALSFAANDDEATRIVLIGDAPPHAERDYLAQAKRLGLLKRPVYSFVVGGHPETRRTFQEISSLSGGLCTDLRTADDLLDFVALTMADDIGGHASVASFLEKHHKQLSKGAAEFAQRLLRSGR